MTAVLLLERTERTDRANRAGTTLVSFVAVCGLLALAARQVGVGALAVVVGIGAASLLVPAKSDARTNVGRWGAAIAVGIGGLMLTRLLTGPPLPLTTTPVALVSSVAAAVAEEAFFRRFLYDRLLAWSPGIAVVGSAVAFAAVHIPMYGVAGAALDLAAGFLLSWQRWYSGGWSAPGATHATANVLAFV